MRLAVFTSQFPGLINTFFARDVRALIDAGVDVEVFVLHPLEPGLWSHVPDSLSERVLPRTKVHHVSVPESAMRAVLSARAWTHVTAAAAVAASAVAHGPGALAKTLYTMPKAFGWVAEHGHRFDHVLAYWGNYAATCAYLFHRAAGRPIPFSTFLHAGTDLYRSRIYLEQKLTYADNIIVVCSFNRQFLETTYPLRFDEWAPRIYVHHLGLNLVEMKFVDKPRDPSRLVAVGGLHPGKGFDDLIRAAADIVRRGRKLKTVIVGGGPERPALERLARELNVESSVDFTGWQPPGAVAGYIEKAALLVHPSIGLGDAVPTAIKEAMAIGTPVVASEVAGIPELLDDGRCGVLTPPRVPSALAHAITTLLDDPARRSVLARVARTRAETLFDAAENGVRLARRLGGTQRHVTSRRRAARSDRAVVAG